MLPLLDFQNKFALIAQTEVFMILEHKSVLTVIQEKFSTLEQEYVKAVQVIGSL